MRRMAAIILAVLYLSLAAYQSVASPPQSSSSASSPAMPNCPDTNGSHLNYAGGSFSCGATSSSAPSSGTTSAIGGSLLSVGGCATGTVNVSGATPGEPVEVSASDGTNLAALGAYIHGDVTSSNTVTVSVCAIVALTPPSKTYNVRVIP